MLKQYVETILLKKKRTKKTWKTFQYMEQKVVETVKITQDHSRSLKNTQKHSRCLLLPADLSSCPSLYRTDPSPLCFRALPPPPAPPSVLPPSDAAVAMQRQ